MELFFSGSILLAIGAIGWWLWRKQNIKEPSLTSAGLTILVYRIVTLISTELWGKTTWWQQKYTDQWNHYQIGLGIWLGILLLRKILPKRLRQIGFGIGLGMIVDEITDVLKLIHIGHLPANFRDSAGDLILIGITYLAVVMGFWGVNRIKKAQN